MAEEEMAMANPPDLTANEQPAVASDFEMNRIKSLQGYDESAENGLLKGDITTNRAPSGPAPKVSEEQQGGIESSLIATRQRLGQIRKAEARLGGEQGGAEVGGKLFTGSTGLIIQKIPGIGMLMNRFNKADTGTKIKILERIKLILRLAKTGAAIFDAIRRWIEIFAATIETIIIPILMILGFIPWVFFCAVLQVGPTARVIDHGTKQVNRTLKTLKKFFQEEEQRKAALANLREAEMSAANEQLQNAV